ncbi:MAG: hypothetical protein SFY81_15120 [Verrucomicrobiota bacterium]|nr:hypothetical protein [Verrucomicrobiota bacterium]
MATPISTVSSSGSASGNSGRVRTIVNIVAIVGTFLIMTVLLRVMVKSQRESKSVSEQRAAARREASMALRAETTQALGSYGYVDKNRGVVRMPIERAMQLSLQSAANPAAARSNLIARVEKATAPAPKAPEKPSDFE